MSVNLSHKIIIISGATASGKSALALQVAQRVGGVIINADALQLYRGLPILSAQPALQDRQLLPHRLYGVLDPLATSSLGDWLLLVQRELQQAQQQHLLPIMVGGTGMYITRLVKGTVNIPAIESQYSEQSAAKFAELGLASFRELLHSIDAVSAEKYLDRQRLMRAYEVYLQTQKPMSAWLQEQNQSYLPAEAVIHFNLCPPREQVYANCNQRFAQMLRQGAIAEVAQFNVLLRQHLSLAAAAPINYQDCAHLSITKTIGLKEINDHLQGKIDLDTCIAQATLNTRHYAKRQLTWFRHQFQDTQMITLAQPEDIWRYL